MYWLQSYFWCKINGICLSHLDFFLAFTSLSPFLRLQVHALNSFLSYSNSFSIGTIKKRVEKCQVAEAITKTNFRIYISIYHLRVKRARWVNDEKSCFSNTFAIRATFKTICMSEALFFRLSDALGSIFNERGIWNTRVARQKSGFTRSETTNHDKTHLV